MLFNSLGFVIFLAVMLGVYLLRPKKNFNLFILTGSYVFYSCWDYRFLSLILASTAIDYFCAQAIERRDERAKRKPFLILSIVFNLAMLGFFKYFNFFADSLASLLSLLQLSPPPMTLEIILPVGISFYTFQTMSYTIDVYLGKCKAERNFIAFASFVAFFPQLVAGPIERANDLLPQIKRHDPLPRKELSQALWLMLWGYFLKVFMADNLAVTVDKYYEFHQQSCGLDALIAHYAFAFQIFGDFAGYSYIAIGVAMLFGVRLSDNFRFPYFIATPSSPLKKSFSGQTLMLVFRSIQANESRSVSDVTGSGG